MGTYTSFMAWSKWEIWKSILPKVTQLAKWVDKAEDKMKLTVSKTLSQTKLKAELWCYRGFILIRTKISENISLSTRADLGNRG